MTEIRDEYRNLNAGWRNQVPGTGLIAIGQSVSFIAAYLHDHHQSLFIGYAPADSECGADLHGFVHPIPILALRCRHRGFGTLQGGSCQHEIFSLFRYYRVNYRSYRGRKANSNCRPAEFKTIHCRSTGKSGNHGMIGTNNGNRSNGVRDPLCWLFSRVMLTPRSPSSPAFAPASAARPADLARRCPQSRAAAWQIPAA